MNPFANRLYRGVEIAYLIAACSTCSSVSNNERSAKQTARVGGEDQSAELQGLEMRTSRRSATIGVQDSKISRIESDESTEIAGASATIRPNSVAIETTILMDGGSSVGNDITGAYLEVPPGSVAMGPSVSVASSNGESQAEIPYVLQIPIYKEMGLAAADAVDSMAVMFRSPRPGGAIAGLIPQEELTKLESGYQFSATHFGTYQLVKLVHKARGRLIVNISSKMQTRQEERRLGHPELGTVPVIVKKGGAGGTVETRLSDDYQDDIVTCLTIVDRDQVAPYDYSFVDSNPGRILTHEFVPEETGKYQARLICESKEGSVSSYSGWSAEVEISKDVGDLVRKSPSFLSNGPTPKLMGALAKWRAAADNEPSKTQRVTDSASLLK